jgi:hypothetical protein
MLYPELRLEFVDEVPAAPAPLANTIKVREVPKGETACHVAENRVVAIEGDEIVLLAAGDGAGPPQELERQTTYNGRLVATLGNVVVLAGEDAPWVFFRCQGDHLIPVGEIRRDTLQIFEHILMNDRIYLIGRGAGTAEQVVIPVLDQPPLPPSVGHYDHLEAWRTMVGISHSADGWHSYRSFQEVLAEVLAATGIAVLAVPGKTPATLVLWFRDSCAGLSVLAVPRSALLEETRFSLWDLDGLHLAENDRASRIQRMLHPFWQFAVGLADEDQERLIEIAEQIENVVCVRTS